MKLRSKLLAAPLATAIVALGAAGANGWLLQSGIDQERLSTARDIEDYKTLGSAHAQLGVVQAAVYRTLAILDSLDDAQAKAFTGGIRQQVDAMKRSLTSLAQGGRSDPELQRLLAGLLPQTDTYLKQLIKAVELTAVDTNMGVGSMKAAEQTYGQLAKGLTEAVARTEAAYKARQLSAETTIRRNTLVIGVLALLAVLAAVGAAAVMQRRLTRDLQRAVALSEAVAEGNLTVQATTERSDEIGELVQSLQRMVTRLHESLQTVHAASNNIGVAAGEIAVGNADLSQRTEQTASNLQATASSMSQLTGTVRQSADAASQANQLATSAAQVARRGGEVVSQVVSTMDEINTSSRKISDIIGTIDGIAFQTNILALNAAVEAARAGEQGRGFAVVAGEVRSLAQRSAEAAREIKALIGASVDRVEAGARLVQDAGGTMDEIVSSVQRVSDIIAEISAAASEQSGGIGQVNQSVAQLDQMTQQNAALVEQSAAAAESLKAQSQSLAEVVNRFQLGSRQPPAAALAATAIGVARAAPRPRPAPPADRPTPAPALQPAAARATDDWETF
jgi:methyl-accepting chemotaxis protein